jgi:hypothetical protein
MFTEPFSVNRVGDLLHRVGDSVRVRHAVGADNSYIVCEVLITVWSRK